MSTRNLVTPEDVGRRVSFQFELPNGYQSEVVGILESYDAAADTYFVRTKANRVERVPGRGIRFGKVVS
ncbi:MAG: hypothetical protein ACJ76P_10615 [Actinomycetota bacterium]|jgi:hypothetical protein